GDGYRRFGARGGRRGIDERDDVRGAAFHGLGPGGGPGGRAQGSLREDGPRERGVLLRDRELERGLEVPRSPIHEEAADLERPALGRPRERRRAVEAVLYVRVRAPLEKELDDLELPFVRRERQRGRPVAALRIDSDTLVEELADGGHVTVSGRFPEGLFLARGRERDHGHRQSQGRKDGLLGHASP